MQILAVDSASERLLCGIATEERILAEYNGPADRNHSERIISVLDSLLRQADIDGSRLDALAVTVGPGSFTGLRVGIASVLGLAEAWSKEITSVGNFELAQDFFEQQGIRPLIAIHCRGDEFYLSPQRGVVELLAASEIGRRYTDREIAGSGAEQLLKKLGELQHRLLLCQPPLYSAGEMATLIARKGGDYCRLNPVELDVSYYLKSQPEQARDGVTGVYIADLATEDLDEVMRIERDSFSDPWERENFLSDIFNSHVIALAARRVGQCVGYASCVAADDYGYIANIAVDRSARSRGIGRTILSELHRRLRQRGITQMLLDVRVSNEKAIEFYKKYGFNILVRREGFYSKPPEDSYTMIFNES